METRREFKRIKLMAVIKDKENDELEKIEHVRYGDLDIFLF